MWDDRTGSLRRVEAVAGAVARLDVATDHEQRFHVLRHVGSLVLREDGKGVLLAAQGGFYSLDTGTGAVALLAAVQADDPQIVMNDGACDLGGAVRRRVASAVARPGSAGLYRYPPPSSATPLLEGAGLRNGLCWEAACTTLLWVDALLGRVERLGYDLERGTVTSRATAMDLTGWSGLPDGIAMDAEGCLWVAFWRGGGIRRFDLSGRLLAEVSPPVLRTTSCCFGGEDLATSTSPRRGKAPGTSRRRWALAGAVLRVRVDVPGVPVPRWRAYA